MEGTEKSSLKAIDSAIFNYFKDLTSNADNARLTSGFKLIEHLRKVQDLEKRKKELHYVLRRLVRGVGASTSASRAGFFSTLVTILKVITPDELNNDELFNFVEKELHVGKAVATKNDADAVVGRILSCAALIRSERISSCSDKEISKIVQMLVKCSKHRSYHNSLALSLLCELVQKSNEEQFVEHIWPVVREDLSKPWEKQTVNTVHCLLVVADKFPKVLSKKFMLAHFGGHQLLNNTSYKHLLRIFWDPNSKELVAHPAFEYFAKYLVSSKSLEEFWVTEVDELISSRTKLREVVTLKVLTDVLLNAEIDKVKASILLTPNIMQMIVASLKTMKFKKDEVMQAFYDEFLEALTSFAIKSEDDEKVNVIQKLILRPGTLDIEKYSPHRIIHQIIATLGEEGIQKVYKVYKDIFLDRIPKNSKNSEETWLNVERQNAGYILQMLIAHKSVQMSFDWRTEELKFMLTYSLFFVNDKEEICNEKEDAGILTNDLAAQLKNIFFTSLQSKMPRLYDAKMILLSLVDVSNEVFNRKNYSKCLRSQLDEKVVKVWKDMYSEIRKEDMNNKLQLVFHLLLLYMGLQLFREPEMAQAAIIDLEKCLERAKKKVAKTSKQKEGDLETEPEWIEVVVDLFLHLLSQNNSALRTIVNSVFPHLCSSLTYTGMHQILSVLDMKVGNDLLSADDVVGNDDIEEEYDQVDNVETGSEDTDDSGGEEEEDDDEEIIEEEEEESTATDQLRNAVSVALGSFVKSDDQDSVDLDDLDEDEGNKLDEALAAAFKAIKGPEQGKKSKSFRVKTTTTMHFRTRVLDLIEIYLQHSPDLVMVLEIMLALYNMIEFCGDAELKPLANKVEKVLMKLTSLRSFASTKDITEQNICDFIRTVVDKKVKASAFEILNKIRAKCCVFLIACSKTLEDAGKTNGNLIVDTFKEYIIDFMKLRNPAINAILLGDIFKMRWKGILDLATTLAENGLSENTRQFRRIQIIELIDAVYKNYTLIKEYDKDAEKLFQVIETALQNHISCLALKNQHSIREFTTILNVLHSAQRCHSKTPSRNNFDKEKLCTEIQSIRKRVKLENQQSYNRFCSVFGLKPIKNFEITRSDEQKLTNGNHKIESTDDDEENLPDPTSRINNACKSTQDCVKPQITRKRKSGQDLKKQKKLRKEKRMKKSSEGLNGGISFKSTPIEVNVSQIEIPDSSDSST